MATGLQADFYVKQKIDHNEVLMMNVDHSIKVASHCKVTSKTLLRKAYPTSKQALKFTVESQLEIDTDDTPALTSALAKVSQEDTNVFVVVSESFNYRREKCRLIIRTATSHPGLEILNQRVKDVIPENDMVFDDDDKCSGSSFARPATCFVHVEQVWEDEYWGSFHVRQADKLSALVAGLRKYYNFVKPKESRKKRVKTDAEDDHNQGEKRSAKRKIVMTDDDNVACEFIDVNEDALVELLCTCERLENLSVREVILRFNEAMNVNLSTECKYDYLNLIRNDECGKVHQVLAKMNRMKK